MHGILKQPGPPKSPARGWLCREQSHTAYVTNDMDRALDIFAGRYGLGDYSFIEGPMPQGGSIKVAFAWAGGQIYEIIQAHGPQAGFYNEMLPENEFAIRFHHLGFVIHDEAGWRQLEQELKESDWPLAYSTQTGTFIDAYYIKAPELGHYIEYVRPFQAGLDFYAAVPVS